MKAIKLLFPIMLLLGSLFAVAGPLSNSEKLGKHIYELLQTPGKNMLPAAKEVLQSKSPRQVEWQRYLMRQSHDSDLAQSLVVGTLRRRAYRSAPPVGLDEAVAIGGWRNKDSSLHIYQLYSVSKNVRVDERIWSFEKELDHLIRHNFTEELRLVRELDRRLMQTQDDVGTYKAVVRYKIVGFDRLPPVRFSKFVRALAEMKVDF